MPGFLRCNPAPCRRFLLRSNSVNFYGDYGDYGDYMVDDFMKFHGDMGQSFKYSSHLLPQIGSTNIYWLVPNLIGARLMTRPQGLEREKTMASMSLSQVWFDVGRRRPSVHYAGGAWLSGLAIFFLAEKMLEKRGFSMGKSSRLMKVSVENTSRKLEVQKAGKMIQRNERLKKQTMWLISGG